MIINYTEIGGWCPFQAHGNYKYNNDQYSFFFKDRHEQSSISIWKGLEPYSWHKLRDKFLLHEYHPEPIGLDYHKNNFQLAKKIIKNHITKFHERKTTR